MRDRICIVCGRPLEDEALMTLTNMPASAQDIPAAEELEHDQGISLSLCQCGSCGLVQLDCEPVSYYKDVIRSGGFTSTMVNLRRSQYRYFIEKYHLEGKKLIEAGCGQGEFLSLLSEFPVKAYGIENRESLVGIGKEKGLTVWKQFAKEGEVLAAGDGSAHGPYDGFLSFNFLEHQPDPVGMLRCLADNLTDEGTGLITVPSLEYILKHDGYYELIRDHLAYYTFDTLRYGAEMAGFTILEEEIINRDTLSVIVRKRKQEDRQPRISRKQAVDVSGLKESLNRIDGELKELCTKLGGQGKSLAIWGAGHQGFTLASTTVIGRFAKYMIDSAPFKQGRYAPSSHLPIVAPEHYLKDPADAVLIAAPGYTDEIAGIIQEKYGGQIEIFALKSNHMERI